MNALQGDPLAAESVRARAREIVDGLHPAAPTSNWFADLLERLGFLDAASRVASPAFEVVLYAASAFAAVFLAGWLVRQAEWGRARAAGQGGRLPQDVRLKVEVLLGRARAARAGGDRLLALRLYFAALVVGLSRLGSLDFRESWTNHELALRGAHTPELRALLVPLVDELDPLVYGGRAVTDLHLDRLEALCRGIER